MGLRNVLFVCSNTKRNKNEIYATNKFLGLKNTNLSLFNIIFESPILFLFSKFKGSKCLVAILRKHDT